MKTKYDWGEDVYSWEKYLLDLVENEGTFDEPDEELQKILEDCKKNKNYN